MRNEKTQRCAANHIPSAGRGVRVNTGLVAPNSNRPSRNFLSRHWPPRRGQLAREPAQVGKARREPQTAYPIVGIRMSLNHFLGGKPDMIRHLVKIESEFLVITDWYLDSAGR